MIGYGNSLFLTSHRILANSASGGGVDPDAQAFITAAAITDLTQQSAINQLVLDLKGYGVWTKMKAVYPFVGGTASQHKFNLKDPRDLDAAFRLVFNGGWTHSSTGVTPNGTNAYADTRFSPMSNSTLNSMQLSFYSRTNSTNDNRVDIGCYDAGGFHYTLIVPYYLGKSTTYIQTTNLASPTQFTDSNSLGFYLASRTANNLTKLYKNGISSATSTDLSTANPISNIFIGANGNNGSATNYSNRQLALASIGDGLTDTDASNFYTAVQNFQTTLGRSIGTQTVSDADAQAFVTAANIQDQVEANAVNNLVIGMKADGIWTKMKAIYPFVGGTASTHKFNLKDPRDLDAAFRLVFNGGWTHSANGALPNGVNGYADTFLNENSVMTLNNEHISFYSRTNTDGLFCDIGVSLSSPVTETNIFAKYLNVFYPRIHDSNSGVSNTISSLGLFISNRVASNQIRAFQNNVLKTINSTSVGSKVNRNFYLGALSSANFNASLYSNRQLALASIGDGLTDTEASNFYTAVQAFQTTLNRQV